MPLKPHPTDPDKVVYARREYDMTPTPVVVELRRLERINAQLLEALEGFVNHGTCFDEEDMAKARAAIKVAKGEA
jgi:hypothetical protein